MDSAATAQLAQPASQPLAGRIRDLLADDAELRALQDDARRRRIPAVVRLPLSICPADFTRVAISRCGERTVAPEWRCGIRDPWTTWTWENIRRRVTEVLTAVFDQLRDGRLEATGILPASGARTCVPRDLWCAAEAVTLDTRTGALLAAPTTLFCGVEVAPPAARAPLSEAAARRYLESFATALEAAGRTFSTREAAEALRCEYPDAPTASTRQVARLLRQMKPPAWSNGGRRPVFQVPSATEIAAAGEAARQAAAEIRT